jgi:hypothetical protein
VEEASPLLFQVASFSSPSTLAPRVTAVALTHQAPPIIDAATLLTRARAVSCGSTTCRAHGLCWGGRLHCAPQFGGGSPALGNATRPSCPPPGVGWTVCTHAQRDRLAHAQMMDRLELKDGDEVRINLAAPPLPQGSTPR